MKASSPGVTVLRKIQDPLAPHAGAVDALLAASGDSSAFERLYRTHVARVHTLACRMMGTHDAKEVTQDVFVRAWEKLATFRGEAAFGTWLHRLAVNLILSRRQRRTRERERFDDSEGAIDALPGASRTSDAGMDFDSAVGRLPEGARQVFVLHDIEGYRHEEISLMLGVSAGTSKAQLHRARMMLRRHLDR